MNPPMERLLHSLLASFIALVAMRGAGGGPEAAAEWLIVSVRPQAVLEGATIEVRCRIMPHRDNRWVELGIEGVRSSAKTIEGDRAPRIYDLKVEQIPCGAKRAYCWLGRAGEATLRAAVNIQVGGCDRSLVSNCTSVASLRLRSPLTRF